MGVGMPVYFFCVGNCIDRLCSQWRGERGHGYSKLKRFFTNQWK
jgi:hypothetical protein